VDYTTTSMRLWHWYVNSPIDPSLYRYVYPPAVFLLPLPAYALAHWLGAPFDIRLIDLAVEVVAALAVLKLPWRWEWRYLLLGARPSAARLPGIRRGGGFQAVRRLLPAAGCPAAVASFPRGALVDAPAAQRAGRSGPARDGHDRALLPLESGGLLGGHCVICQ